ncbi:MAG TPA: YhjD/YihY/BrkB family envelope integrity protein [Ilumatobacteraceae bacterium]|jgi:uncharacterized BrkB/YihY/UPF0761 family membrane protein|nr:YhjD/YihY/BrkB family envelope integrity protein [Ilumatobacteraceae bacterium]
MDQVDQETPPDDAEAAATTGVAGLIAWSRQHADEGQTWASTFLDEHKDRFVIDIGERLYRRDKESAGTIVGSAIAFRLFLFFVPLMLFIVGLAGFLAQWLTAQDVSGTSNVSSGLAKQINTALSQSGSGRWVAVFLGLIGIATTGRSLSKVLVTTSCLTWRLPITSKASVKVIGGVVGVIAAIGLMATIINRIREHLGIGVAGLSFIGAMAFYAIAWTAVSLMLPRGTSDPGALLPGSAIVAVTIAAMQAVSQLYLPSKMSHASSLYGAIGTTIVTLGWFFIFGRAVVFGMVMNAVIYDRFGSISQAVLSLPVVRILPRKSAWIRKFFDVDVNGKGDDSNDAQANAASSDSTDGAK